MLRDHEYETRAEAVKRPHAVLAPDVGVGIGFMLSQFFSVGFEHKVTFPQTDLFDGDGERIEISHKSASRQSYAQGSLRAARFLQKQNSGLYDMQDVLGLRK